MADTPLPRDVEATDRIFPAQSVGEGAPKEGLATPTQSFSSFMQQGTASPLATAGKTPMVSPFAMMQGTTPLAQTGMPTIDTLLAQSNSVISTLGDINSQLNTPNLKLKSSTKYVVKNKMMDANMTLRSANQKLGADVPEPPDPSTFQGPLGRFFAYLSDGQAQMEAAKQQLQNLKNKGQALTPGDFLLVQVKLNKAQQELEFSSVLLSNAVSALKTLMQVQL